MSKNNVESNFCIDQKKRATLFYGTFQTKLGSLLNEWHLFDQKKNEWYFIRLVFDQNKKIRLVEYYKFKTTRPKNIIKTKTNDQEGKIQQKKKVREGIVAPG